MNTSPLEVSEDLPDCRFKLPPVPASAFPPASITSPPLSASFRSPNALPPWIKTCPPSPPSTESVLLPRPPLIATIPPLRPLSSVSPAVRSTAPPSAPVLVAPCDAIPTDRLTSPPVPCSESPVRTATYPEPPKLALPVLTNTLPLVRLSSGKSTPVRTGGAECSVPMSTLPLEVLALAPLRSSMLPPNEVDARPPVSNRSPPVSVSSLRPSATPPCSITEPPLPPSLASALLPIPADT
mmetsp:Transcript_24497/g.83756  ORF Transcript_24497/g.83756 Transcript_24497/m.83756 type:complete len:239 (-) Transcript_24497:453-1169(-)